MKGPSGRSKTFLEEQGFRVGNVQRWIAPIKRYIDLYGFIDLIGMRRDVKGLLAIQATDGSNVAHRWTKILREKNEDARIWLEAGNRIEIHGWRKAGPKGSRKTWEVRVVPVTLEDLDSIDESEEKRTSAKRSRRKTETGETSFRVVREPLPRPLFPELSKKTSNSKP